MKDYAGPDWAALGGMTVPALMAFRARRQPTALALSAPSWRGYRDRLSYAHLDLYGRRIGAGLAALGVEKGQRVAIYLDNAAAREAVLTALGCFAIGAVAVPFNTRAADPEIAHALALTKPSAVVTISAAAERLRGLGAPHLVLLDAADEAQCWPEPTVTHIDPVAETVIEPGDLACLLFTSGTTGRSKAVMHTHRSMLATGFSSGVILDLGPQDIYQGAFPFFTSSCLNIGCMAPWVHGAGFVTEPALTTSQRLRLIESECTTVYHGVPSILQFMLDEAEGGAYGLRRVRRLAYGGAAMPAATIARIAAVWPWMEQVHGWGLSESGPCGAWLPPDRLPEKAGSVGKAMPNCELRLIDELGAPVPDGQPGELCFRGPSMSMGYYDDPVATAETFRDGWLHSGDIFIKGEDGLLRFVDRKKDVINRGGIKVSSAMVEEALYRIPGVSEAAAVAVPHPRLGEAVAACLVLADGIRPDTESMVDRCRGLLADYEMPRHWFFFDEMPRNPMGKILKRDLRQKVLRRMDSEETNA